MLDHFIKCSPVIVRPRRVDGDTQWQCPVFDSDIDKPLFSKPFPE